jgi:hypothetical protein
MPRREIEELWGAASDWSAELDLFDLEFHA